MEEAIRKADVLIEALPYIQRFADKPVIIKFGGNAMESDEILDDVLEDIVFLATVGIRPIIVHGGGPQISRAMEKAGMQPAFRHGLRVTDAPTLELVVRVLTREVCADLVDRIRQHGGRPVAGFREGETPLRAERARVVAPDGEEVDLGYVGDICSVDRAALLDMTADGRIAVLPPVGRGDDGQLYNVNADTAAGAVAASVGAEKVVFLSNVHGIMAEPGDTDSLISTLAEREVESLIERGVIAGGMLPKVRACLAAVHAGVRKAHIIDGRLPHSLLLEIFTDRGVGTQIVHRSPEA